MKLFNLRQLTIMLVLGLFTILGTSEMTFAQGKRGHDQKKGRHDNKQSKKADKAQERAEQRRIQAERERQAEWTRQNQRILAEQRRQADIYKRNNRSNNVVYYDPNANNNQNGRYRVYRNGQYYNTNQRGADLLRQAVNQGYRQGFEAGRNDRNGRRRSSWTTSNVYRSGNSGYQNHVSQSRYQYYFRQGFQRGYMDGYNTQYQNDYYGDYQYGSNNGGSLNILGTILGQILNIQSY
jgi:hypothetical protein